jgi:hypothetical protein
VKVKAKLKKTYEDWTTTMTVEVTNTDWAGNIVKQTRPVKLATRDEIVQTFRGLPKKTALAILTHYDMKWTVYVQGTGYGTIADVFPTGRHIYLFVNREGIVKEVSTLNL